MNFKLNMGAWSNVFAVPTQIVDKHLKTAGHKQLQVLLYMLRNADKELSIELLSKEFNMHPMDAKDCLIYWENENILCKIDNEYKPSETTQQQNNDIVPTKSDDVKISNQLKPTKKVRTISKPQKPDMIFVASRIKNSSELQYLMREAEAILSKPLSNSDFSTLVMLYDDDGLPIDVIIMILQYAKAEGKASMRYIESLGLNWASEEIDTLEKAEMKISQIKRNRSNWEKISKIFGIKNTGSPTKYQVDCSARWLDEWKYSSEMIRLAYEISVDSKGIYNLKYIDGIIKRWRKDAIQTKEDYDTATTSKKENAKTDNNKSSSFNLDTEEQSDLFDI